jgi:hypothetical protein
MRFLILNFLLIAVLAGCGSGRRETAAAEFLRAEESVVGEKLGQEAVLKGVARFQEFFKDVTPESVRRLAPELYAPEIWFNDTLKTLKGRNQVEAYFLKTAEHVDFVRAKVMDSAISGRNCYVRWVMDVQFKGAQEPIRTVGMTLLRFNREGQVVLHQDFWDSSAGFYEHLPLIGGVLRWIKSKI